MNSCEYCQYANEATDIFGNTYFQCALDDNPDNYGGAVCSGGDDGVF